MPPSNSAQLLAEVPAHLIEQFRKDFLARFKKDIDSNAFDKRDMEDMLDDLRIRCYLHMSENNVEEALKKTRDVFLWRNEQKVRDIKFSDIPPTILRGVMFWRNKDTEGNNVFWFRVRFNKKGVMNTEKKKYFAFLLEQHYQKWRGERATFVFDMTDSGLGQADMDVLRYMIGCFQHHYPFLVHNLVVYKLPWILEGIWKIVKSWLSAKAQERVKFVSDPTIMDTYVARENRFVNVAGGFDKFAETHGDGDKIFLTYSDLYYGTPRADLVRDESFAASDCHSLAGGISLAAQSTICDSVTLNGSIAALDPSPSIASLPSPPGSPTTELATEATGLDPSGGTSSPIRKVSGATTVSSTPTLSKVNVPPKKPPHLPPRLTNRSVSSNEPLLEFSPDSLLVFDKTATSNDVIEAAVQARNVSGGIVAYKVKSTSMTRYRSRPCAGFIQSGTIRNIHISCRLQDRAHLPNDRFLIQYIQVSEAAFEEVTRGGVPPATAASQLLGTKHENQRMFEKKLTPVASHALQTTVNGALGHGDQTSKTHATPTPPLSTHSNGDDYLKHAGDSSTHGALSSAAKSNSADELSRLVVNELARQRRYLNFMTLIVTAHFLLFVAYLLVFHVFSDEFRSSVIDGTEQKVAVVDPTASHYDPKTLVTTQQ